MTCFPNDERRLKALADGKKRWIGPICASCDTAERNAINGQCVECNKRRSRNRARRIAATPEEKERRRLAAVRRQHDREARERKRDTLARPRPKSTPLAEMPQRLAAIAAGARTWGGPACRACGGTIRRVQPPCACHACRRTYELKRQPRKKDDPAWHEALAVKKAETARKAAERRLSRNLTDEQRAKRANLYRKYRERRKNDPVYIAAKRERDLQRRNTMSPEQKRAYRQARRAREASAPGSHTAEDIAALASKQSGKCAYCSTPWDHVDHRTPLSRGGSNDAINLQLLCAFHNVSKGAKTAEEFEEFLEITPDLCSGTPKPSSQGKRRIA